MLRIRPLGITYSQQIVTEAVEVARHPLPQTPWQTPTQAGLSTFAKVGIGAAVLGLGYLAFTKYQASRA